MIMFYISYLLIALMWPAAAFLIYKTYTQKVRLQSEYIDMQIRMMVSHYGVVQRQIHQMEYCQRMIDDQMRGLTAKDSEIECYEQTTTYLKSLRSEYQKLRAGMYCDD